MGDGGINAGKIFEICERIMYFFCVNLFFLLSNIPVLLFLLFIGMGGVREYLPLFLFGMSFCGPAFSAVIYCMNKVIAGTETHAFRDYKRGYLSDWLQKYLLCFCHMCSILIIYTSLEFFTFQISIFPLRLLMYIMLAVDILVSPNLYLIASRYCMKNREIAKTALTLLFARPGLTLGNTAAFAVMLICLEFQPGTTVLFVGSVYGFLVAFMSRTTLRMLEERSQNDSIPPPQ